jgi:ribosomal protein L21
VTVSVEELTKDKKVITLKVRRRKNSKNIKGFRRDLTILRVKDILLTNDFNKDIGL